jgi:hypothetical protein
MCADAGERLRRGTFDRSTMKTPSLVPRLLTRPISSLKWKLSKDREERVDRQRVALADLRWSGPPQPREDSTALGLVRFPGPIAFLCRYRMLKASLARIALHGPVKQRDTEFSWL